MKKPTLVGTYFLGHENVRLFLRPGEGGEFYLCPKDRGPASIHIGCYTKPVFARVHQVLVHEVLELAMVKLGCRSFPDPATNGSHASYSFHMTHEQMASVSDMVGEFLLGATKDLQTKWKEYVK